MHRFYYRIGERKTEIVSFFPYLLATISPKKLPALDWRASKFFRAHASDRNRRAFRSTGYISAEISMPYRPKKALFGEALRLQNFGRNYGPKPEIQNFGFGKIQAQDGTSSTLHVLRLSRPLLPCWLLRYAAVRQSTDNWACRLPIHVVPEK
jgi:hypothetical protein